MILDEIATYLTGQGVASTGSTASWAIFKGFEPDTPHNCLSIFETGGDPNDQHEATPIDRPTFQLRVRATDHGYSTGRAKIAAARTALEAIGPATTGAGGWYYVQVMAMSEPVALGIDENQRPRWVQNYRAIRSRTS